MKEEARSKKQLQATSGKKQETRSQEATSGWKTGHFLPEKSLQTARARRKKTRKKKQEARSNYRQQAARSKKQEARKQQAAGRQVREARNNKPGSNKRLEDRSEKQETRSQEATSGWKTGQRASFLVDSESNVRQAAGRQVREARNKKPGSNKRLEDRSES